MLHGWECGKREDRYPRRDFRTFDPGRKEGEGIAYRVGTVGECFDPDGRLPGKFLQEVSNEYSQEDWASLTESKIEGYHRKQEVLLVPLSNLQRRSRLSE
jgi:hypothetical protein